MEFSQPGVLLFISSPVDQNRAIQKGLTLTSWTDKHGKKGWISELDMTSEEVHFFARSKESQLECLEGFLARCLETTIEVREQQEPKPEASP